jgi:hypothetical protein
MQAKECGAGGLGAPEAVTVNALTTLREEISTLLDDD